MNTGHRAKPGESTDREYDEWLRLFESRDAVADWYAEALACFPPTWKGWQRTNEAIVRRWSLSALTYIKTQAWKRAKEVGDVA